MSAIRVIACRVGYLLSEHFLFFCTSCISYYPLALRLPRLGTVSSQALLKRLERRCMDDETPTVMTLVAREIIIITDYSNRSLTDFASFDPEYITDQNALIISQLCRIFVIL